MYYSWERVIEIEDIRYGERFFCHSQRGKSL
nr:MAG TPA: hypothetical protein [Caudoviricetes sp.]